MVKHSTWIMLILGGLSNLTAQNLMNGPTELSAMIRLDDVKPYYPNSEVPILVTLTNNGADPLLLHMAQQRPMNIRFFAVLQTGMGLPGERQETDTLLAHQGQREIFIQPLVLNPGESFSFRSDLKQWLRLSQPGLYEVYGLFVQDPRNQNTVNRTNRITLMVRPQDESPMQGQQTSQMRMNEAREEYLTREELSPDNVIRRILTARKEGREAMYFLYINLEELYRKDPVRNNLFRRSAQAVRERFLMEFRQKLWTQDPELVRIPTGWEIEKTEYDSRTAQVRTLLWYDQVDFTSRRRFVFILSRKDRYWELTDYYMEVLQDVAMSGNRQR